MNKQMMPRLRFGQVFNISFGFLGVQIGYSLQTGNISRILAAFGANLESLSYFWLAAPLAGLIVQPLIGLSSDQLWTRLGRRIPFILLGALISTLAMVFMPNAAYFTSLMQPLVFGACMLLFMDTAFNITMQPFRALVGDMLPDQQRNLGYSIQSLLINVGAVLGSLLPFILERCGVANVPAPGEHVAATVTWSFYLGGACLLLTVVWTSLKTKEYPPAQYAQYHELEVSKPKLSLIQLFRHTPATMYQLAVVQFFSWFALFIMWVYTTAGIAENVWQTSANDTTSAAFNAAGNWVGVIFAAYSVFAALFAVVMTKLSNKYGRKAVYLWSLIAGGVGLGSMMFIHNQYLLLLAMVGVGIAWSAILAMPYAILSGVVAADKMGVYMGLFNASITLPQIAAGILGGLLLNLVGQQAINMLGVAGCSMLIAAFSVLLIKDQQSTVSALEANDESLNLTVAEPSK